MDILTKEEKDTCIKHFDIIKETLSKIDSESENLLERIKRIKEEKKKLEDYVPLFGKKIAFWFFSKKEELLKKQFSKSKAQHSRLEKYHDSYLSVFDCIKFAKNPLSEDLIDAFTSLSAAFKLSPSLPLEVSAEVWEIKNRIQERMKIPNKHEREAFTLRGEGGI